MVRAARVHSLVTTVQAQKLAHLLVEGLQRVLQLGFVNQISGISSAMKTEEILMQLVQATQMVATRTSLVHVGASSHLGQLLPTALQLWSQDRLSQQGRGLDNSEASMQLRSLRSSYSEELRHTAVRLASDASLPDIPGGPVLKDGGDSVQAQPRPGEDSGAKQPSRPSAEEGNARREGCPGNWKARPHLNRLRNGLATSPVHCEPSHSAASVQSSSEAQDRLQNSAAPHPEPAIADYLTIEEDEQSQSSARTTSQPAMLEDMSAAGQQLLLLLRVLRNLCATGSDATRAMADVGVPAQVACLISEPLDSNQQGEAQHAPFVWETLSIHARMGLLSCGILSVQCLANSMFSISALTEPDSDHQQGLLS